MAYWTGTLTSGDLSFSETPTFHAELREGGWLHTHVIHPPERSPRSQELSRLFAISSPRPWGLGREIVHAFARGTVSVIEGSLPMRPLLRSLLFLGALAAGQNQPAFEVASIKSVDPSGHPSGLPMGRRIDAGRAEYGSVELPFLIALAYRVKSYQVFMPDSAGTTRLSSVSCARCRSTGSRSATAATTAGAGPEYALLSLTMRCLPRARPSPQD